MKLGLSRLRTAAFMAMGAVLGMIAPPVNILVMIMGAGVDMPYVGVTLPLLVIVVPSRSSSPPVARAAGTSIRSSRVEEMKAILPPSV